MEFFTDPGPWTWLVLGLVLLGAEVATGTTYLLWLAVAAAIMAALTAVLGDLSVPVQLVVFGGLALGVTVAGRRLFPPDDSADAGGDEVLNRPDSRLLGQTVIAVRAFAAGTGRVRFGDSEWQAQSLGAVPVAPGTLLEVVGVDGATLRVKPAQAIAPARAADETGNS
jgi:inner membrane protein